MKILFPTIVDPSFPGGAGTYLRGLIAALQAQPLAATVDWVTPYSPIARFNRLRQSLSLLRSVGSPLPSKAHFQKTGSYLAAVRDRISTTRPDLLALFGADLLWLLDEVPSDVPTVLVALNREHELFRRQVEAMKVPAPLRHWLSRDCEKLHAFEIEGIRRVHHTIFVSDHDATSLQKETGPLHHLAVPPLFAEPRHDRPARRRPDGPPTIGLIGNFGWWRNQVGLRWFIDQVLPLVDADLVFNLYGIGSRELARADSRLIGHGFIENAEEVWQNCDLMICPGVDASGVNVKLAEAVYHSIPVLATSYAGDRLGLSGSEAVVLSDEAQDWAGFLNSEPCREMGTKRIDPEVGDRYSVERHQHSIQQFFSDVAEGR